MYKFEKQHHLNDQTLFKETDSYTIFRHYVGSFKIGKAISSPLPGRKDDNPSFTININRETNEFFYHDKVLGGGDSVGFVQKLFGLNYRQALVTIVRDLGLANKFILTEEELIGASYKKISYQVDIEKLKKESEVEIDIKSRNWNLADKAFWTSYGITKETLKKYNVTPVSHIFIKNKIINADKLAYVFKEFKDFKETLTIYQPFSKNYKWIKTHDQSVWYGWEQLPETGDKLIITKSLKDVMSIRDVTGYISTGLQNENILPKLGVILELRGRFEDIYLLYDNDFNKDKNWGRIAAEKLEKEFGFNLLEIPSKYKSKDFSDLVKNHGKEVAKKVLQKEIDNVIYF